MQEPRKFDLFPYRSGNYQRFSINDNSAAAEALCRELRERAGERATRPTPKDLTRRVAPKILDTDNGRGASYNPGDGTDLIK